MPDERNLNKLATHFFHGYHFGTTNPNGAHYTSETIRDYSTVSDTPGRVAAHFDRIEELFVDLANSFEVVVGAVAWLTSTPILSALSNARHVAIVVQKEDFLRRDSDVNAYAPWKANLHELYNGLKPFSAWDFSETYPGEQEFNPEYNSASQHWLFDATGQYQRGGDAVRCLGYCQTDQRVIPRMHHKFLVFGDNEVGTIMRPRCVASGSFNLTKNAVRSRENVLLIEDQKICHAYLSEWAQLWCLSEPLNWSSPEPVIEHLDMST